jgi:uncharacterized repeat protein (TIGR01451 family)
MPKRRMASIVACIILSLGLTLPAGAFPNFPPQPLALDPSPPIQPVRMVFIHHSTGGVWLDNGLRSTLNANHYFVTETNYGWGDDDASLGGPIGTYTDLGHWWNWFNGPYRDGYTAGVYANNDAAGSNNGVTDPGGPNTIVMFKSCFPNSNLGGSPTDLPPAEGGPNPLRGHDAYSSDMTVANAKGIYRDLLGYFQTRQDHLFIAITAPPLVSGATSDAAAANARAFNNWLVSDWLAGYPYSNVAVFDFYSVLTSNGGNTNTNDLGSASGNHHRFRNGAIEHPIGLAQNTAAYGQNAGDSHPTGAGAQKAAAEYAPLLNIWYHRWHDGAGPGSAPAVTKSTPRRRAEHGDTVPFQVTIRQASLTSDTMTLTDVVPPGLAYAAGTLTATCGAIDATGAPTLRWTGVLSPTPVVTVQYSVQVTWPDPAVLTSTATVSVAGTGVVSATHALWVNPHDTFAPIVLKKR